MIKNQTWILKFKHVFKKKKESKKQIFLKAVVSKKKKHRYHDDFSICFCFRLKIHAWFQVSVFGFSKFICVYFEDKGFLYEKGK